MYRVFFIAILLATAYSHSESALPLDEDDGWELIPFEEHPCDHDHLDVDPMREWKSKYVPNPFVTMEEHIASYRDSSLRNTYLAAPWEGLRVQFDYSALESSVSDHTKRNFIVQELCEPLRNYFSNVFKIKRKPGGISMSSGSCFDINYPAFSYSDKDLVIFVMGSNAPNDSYLA